MSENENTNNAMDFTISQRSVEAAQETMHLFLASADVHAVYAEAIEHGEHLIIPAAEVLSAVGFGYGSGGANEPTEKAGGGGGGGGGRVLSRPVAVIVATPEGVRVKPVFDITKIALASLTAFGFMMTMVAKMRSGKS
jgi:uncharacterized spore protein YtfJ